MWSCVIEDFGRNARPFWYEWGRVGGVFRFLSCGGGFSGFRCVTPPSCWVWCFGLDFSRNSLGFVLESVEGGGVFGFLSVDGLVFTYGQGTPPSLFWYMSLLTFSKLLNFRYLAELWRSCC